MTGNRDFLQQMYAGDRASQWLGITVDQDDEGRAVAHMTVTDDMQNGFGICHGGILFALADTAFAFACNSGEQVTVAATASMDFLVPVVPGDQLTAVAEVRRAGGRTGVYDITVYDQTGATVALFRGRSHATPQRHART